MNGIYFHIDNGGVTIGAEKSSIIVESIHFGNNISSLRLDTTPEGLRMLGKLLIEQADQNEQTDCYIEAKPKPATRPMKTNIMEV